MIEDLTRIACDVIARILYSKAAQLPLTPEVEDALRQLHWTICDVESRYTRRCGPVDADWMSDRSPTGYTMHRRCPEAA